MSDAKRKLAMGQLEALLEAQTKLRKVAERDYETVLEILQDVVVSLLPGEIDDLVKRDPRGLAALEPEQMAYMVRQVIAQLKSERDQVVLTVDGEEITGRRWLRMREKAARADRLAKVLAEKGIAIPGGGFSPTQEVEEEAPPELPEDLPLLPMEGPAPAPPPQLRPQRQPVPQRQPGEGEPPWLAIDAQPTPEEPAVPVTAWPTWARAWREESPNFERDQDVILVLGDTGIARQQDVDEILAQRWGISSGSGSIGRALRRLRKGEIVLVEAIASRREMAKGRWPGHLLRLTERGRDAYRLLRNEVPVPSQTTELLKRHKSAEHAALNLAAANFLWEAGYGVVLFPDPVELDGGTYSPDLVIELNGGRLYVECERATRKRPDERARKWALYYAASEGHFAIVTPGADATAVIREEILAWAEDRPLTLWMTDMDRPSGEQGETVWEKERV